MRNLRLCRIGVSNNIVFIQYTSAVNSLKCVELIIHFDRWAVKYLFLKNDMRLTKYAQLRVIVK